MKYEPLDVEIAVSRRVAPYYGVDMVVRQPGNAVTVHPLSGQSVAVTFDEQELRRHLLDADAYGRALTAMLFGPEPIARAWDGVVTAASTKAQPIRLRLVISRDAGELHNLPWETLRDPNTGRRLAASNRISFSRALASADWRPVTLRARSSLRTLVAIAAPADLAAYGFAPIDAAAESAHIHHCLSTLSPTVLAAPGEASLSALINHLRNRYDVLYLVAHGRLIEGEPWLFLDDGKGSIARVSGEQLTQQLADLPFPPRLIVLASCESAGSGDGEALAALGPRLAVAGIPAVIAMQGPFTVVANTALMPRFFTELQADGRVDRALGIARQAIADYPDWWVPCLFTRLHKGQLWYEPGFEEQRSGQPFARWPDLISSIREGSCTPILGPALLEPLVGSTRDLARRLAEKHRFPLAPYARDDLPQVAQYLAVNQSESLLRAELARTMLTSLSASVDTSGVHVDTALSEAAAQQRKTNTLNPHRVLAGLPLPIYLCATPDRLLADALLEAGKDPQLRTFPWNRQRERKDVSIQPPTAAHPLVYHLFGRLDDRESLVLTEDDYFRYLIGVSRSKSRLLPVVGGALVDTSLLFLGFRLEDWNFRVLFQSVMNLEGAARRRHRTHVAVQIEPQEGVALNPHAAREYLKTYFSSTVALNYQAIISIYWGSAEDFVRELAEHLSGREDA